MQYLLIFFVWILCLTTSDISAQSVTEEPTGKDMLPPEVTPLHPDTLSVHKNIFEKIISYFDEANKDTITRRPKFSFIGGPHYSSDTKFGIGVLAAGLYSTDPENSLLEPSNITLFADVTTGKYYKVGVRGLHLYRENTRRVNYELFFNSYNTYYWGIGVDNAERKSNKTPYLLLNTGIEVDHQWEIRRNVFAGPLLRWYYTSAGHIEDYAVWSTQPTKAMVIEVGIKAQLDSRDNYTYPMKGFFGEFMASYNRGIFGPFKKGFGSIDFNIRNYTSIWHNGVLASCLAGKFTLGDVPWCYMPTLGESGSMRGYYEGQYRDKDEIELTLELRQRVYRRSGIVVWGGGAALFHSFRHIRGKDFLPTYGLGYRWEFKKRTNIRIDIGFGRKCWGVDFNIGEAF